METKYINNYIKDKQLETKFSKIIKGILGNQFIVHDIKMDETEGTDFLMFRANPFKIAVRLRRYNAFLRYRNEFTIRYSRPSRVKTELQKIMEGLVDYLFYGFIDEQEKNIIQYFIGDLRVFRNINIQPKAILSNNPRDSDLAIYGLEQFPSSFIIKRYNIQYAT